MSRSPRSTLPRLEDASKTMTNRDLRFRIGSRDARESASWTSDASLGSTGYGTGESPFLRQRCYRLCVRMRPPAHFRLAVGTRGASVRGANSRKCPFAQRHAECLLLRAATLLSAALLPASLLSAALLSPALLSAALALWGFCASSLIASPLNSWPGGLEATKKMAAYVRGNDHLRLMR
jgi:hypothetical protein